MPTPKNQLVSLCVAGVVALSSFPVRAGEVGTGQDVSQASSESAPAGGAVQPWRGHPDVWPRLIGSELRLTINGDPVEGRLLGASGGQILFARGGDGLVMTLPVTSIAGVELQSVDVARACPRRPTGPGVGLLAGGAVSLALGIPTAIAGVVMSGLCAGCLFITLPLLLIGSPLVGAGAGMIHVGLQRKRDWVAATECNRVACNGPRLMPRGLTLRF